MWDFLSPPPIQRSFRVFEAVSALGWGMNGGSVAYEEDPLFVKYL